MTSEIPRPGLMSSSSKQVALHALVAATLVAAAAEPSCARAHPLGPLQRVDDSQWFRVTASTHRRLLSCDGSGMHFTVHTGSCGAEAEPLGSIFCSSLAQMLLHDKLKRPLFLHASGTGTLKVTRDDGRCQTTTAAAASWDSQWANQSVAHAVVESAPLPRSDDRTHPLRILRNAAPPPATARNMSELRALLSQPGPSVVSMAPAAARWLLGGTPLVIQSDVTIEAAGGTFDAAGLSRVFEVAPGGRLTVRNATLVSGRAEDGGCVYADGDSLTLGGVRLDGCTAEIAGGGVIVTSGEARLVGCSFERCVANSTTEAQVYGGALVVQGDDARVTLYASSVTACGAYAGANQALGGGTIVVSGKLDISGLTMTNTSAVGDSYPSGGGVFVQGGSVIISNSSISGTSAVGDRATGGGVVVKGGSVRISNSSIVNASVSGALDPHGAALYVYKSPTATSLYNVRIHDATGAEAVYAQHGAQLTAAVLHVASTTCEPLIVGSDLLPLRALSFDAPSCAARFSGGVSPLTCGASNQSAWVSATYGPNAACSMPDDDIMSPICTCEPPRYPAGGDPYAPYKGIVASASRDSHQGCIVPFSAANLTLSSSSALFTLAKTTSAPSHSASLTLTIDGTQWQVPGALGTYAWTLVAPPAPWMRVLNASGHVMKPQRPGEAAVAYVPIEVHSSGLPDSLTARQTTLEVDVHLPGAYLAPAPPQRALIPIQLFVSASPIAKECTLDAPGTTLPVILNQPSSFLFTARDVEGLPLSHADGSYNAMCVPREGCTATVTYTGEGNYSVDVSLTQLGEYQVSVKLAGGARSGLLPFAKHVDAICPAYEYSALAINLTSCLPCPSGVSCAHGSGATLPTLNLLANHWRPSNLTTDIRNCTSDNTSVSPCLGGPGPNYCAAGLHGPYCRVCINSSHYFDSSHGECNDCGYGSAAHLMFAIVGSFGCLAIVVALLAGVRSLLAWERAEAVRRLATHLAELGLAPIGKLLLGFYQVTVALPYIYAVQLPHQYYAVMQAFEWVRLDWLRVFSLGHGYECYGGFLPGLVNHSLLSLALVGAVVGVGALAWRSHARDALRSKLIELGLFALFVMVPTVSHRVFSSFACEGFGFDDAMSVVTGEVDVSERYFLVADYSVRCSRGSYRDPAYETIRVAAICFVILWPVGVPLLFACLLRMGRYGIWGGCAQQDGTARVQIDFLTSEYEPDFYWWEVPLMLKKLSLTGFLLLVPQDLVFLRLVAALLVCIAYLILLLYSKPYREPTTAAVAVGVNVTLVCLFFTALLIKMANASTLLTRKSLFGTDSVFSLTVLLILFNVGLLVGTVALLSQQLRHQQNWMRFAKDGVAAAPRNLSKGYHAFVSHQWGGGQDQARAIKAQLAALIPGLRVFLDVDDLSDIGALEEHVDGSDVVIVFLAGSNGDEERSDYMRSANCVRELRQAIERKKRIVFVLETDPQHGAVSMGTHRRDCPDDLRHALAAHPIVPWYRIRPYAQVSLRQIAERVLGVPLRLPNDPLRASPTAPDLHRLGCAFHLYHPPNWGGEVVRLLCREAANLAVTTRMEERHQAHRFLLYLNAATPWDDGLQAAVEAAIAGETPLLMIHEQRDGHGAVPFDQIIAQTPRALLDRKIYDALALPLYDGEEHERVCLYAMVKSMGNAEASGLAWRCCALSLPRMRTRNVTTGDDGEGRLLEIAASAKV